MRKIVSLISLSKILAFAIISSAIYARPLYRVIISIIPRELVSIIIGTILIAATGYTALLSFQKISSYKAQDIVQLIFKLLILSTVFTGLFLTLELPEERIHIILFAVLGALRGYEIKEKNIYKAYLKTAYFILLTSLCAEGLQGLLPDRYADIRDVAVDFLSGNMGWLLMAIL